MDGTLTLPVHDFEAIRSQLGLPSGSYILETIDAMPAAKARKLKSELDEIELELAQRALPQPAVWSLLDKLKSQNKKLGILTRNSERLAKITLEACGLREFFPNDAIVGRESCTPKPDPAGILHLLQLWSASPEETVIVGDYLFDLEAGRNAGIKTVHFDQSGEFSWSALTDVKTTELAELKRFV